MVRDKGKVAEFEINVVEKDGNRFLDLQGRKHSSLYDLIMGARCAFSDKQLHSRMPLDPTHVRFNSEHACDQWHSSRGSTPLTVVTINYAETLKVQRRHLIGPISKQMLPLARGLRV
jgi:hypothetical protein